MFTQPLVGINVLSGLIIFIFAGEYHPSNVYPVRVTAGISPVTELVIPVNTLACPFLTYKGLVPDNIPSFGSNVSVAL